MKNTESSNSLGRKVERWLSGAVGRESEKLQFNGNRVSVLQDEKFWR